MGLKWEYCRAPQRPVMEEHWDAEAFVQFFKGITPHHQRLMTPNGEKHRISRSVPRWNETIKDALTKTLLTALEAAVVTAIATGSATLVITLPTWVPAAVLVLVLGEMARRQIWKQHEDSKLMNIRLVCPTEEIYDGVNRYFQGTWELP